ncbi:MAG: carboxymuconolactone decarboxylase family protein [Gammaproteobacteria bacterium]|nr:carboxymuconolactone decarboxylase family protein [Gammaproteobacteria bacterium]
MTTVRLIEYQDAEPAVRAVYDDIRATRKTDFINNFWKALANNPVQLAATWQAVKAVMAPGALDALTKELIYIAVSVANSCEYCTHSHTAAARAKGMSDAQHAELLAVIGMAFHTNGLVNAMQVEVDDVFRV